MSRPAVREIGDRNAYWHYQETGFGSWLWIYQGRGRTGILLPPQWHRGRLRRPPGWREGSVRNRVEPQGPARQERPRRLSSTTRSSPGEIRGSFFWGLVSRPDSFGRHQRRLTRRGTSSFGRGYFGFICRSVSTRIIDTAQLR